MTRVDEALRHFLLMDFAYMSIWEMMTHEGGLMNLISNNLNSKPLYTENIQCECTQVVYNDLLGA